MIKWTAILFLLAAPAMAATTTVKCSGKYENKTETIEVKLDSRGKWVKWDSARWAKTSKNSLFSYFGSKDMEGEGVEWNKVFLARNGFAIMNLGTTADSFTIGISLKAMKGFFKYDDIGSGAGNFGFPLDCKRTL